MKLHVQLLRHHGYIRDTFRADGWAVKSCPENSLVAEHPDVPDEAAARDRLEHLGLLTANCLRIDFGPLPMAFTEV
jgi:hypothetical protein